VILANKVQDIAVVEACRARHPQLLRDPATAAAGLPPSEHLAYAEVERWRHLE
jgi:hypothetical protein